MPKQQKIQKNKLESSSGLFKDNTKLVLKSLISGLVIGTVFTIVAVFGLVSAFIEFLKPILVPRIEPFTSFFVFLKNVSGASSLIIALVRSWLTYTTLILVILLIQKYVEDRKLKFFAILFVILVFLALTGMFTNLYYFLSSPNKSWIFQVGA
jgi:hypothetical protein